MINIMAFISVFGIKQSVIGIVFVSVMLLFFILFAFLIFFNRSFAAKKRHFITVELGVNLMFFSVSLFNKVLHYSLFFFGYSIVLAGFLYIIPQRKSVQKDKEKPQGNTVKFNIENNTVNNNARQFLERIKCKPLETEINRAKSFNEGIDYTQVISILDRLARFKLSSQDSEIVDDLKTALKQANDGDDSIELKTKINDGLSALLKIMAKYSV